MQYIDYVGSWGPAIVGHAHPEVTEALTEQIKKVRGGSALPPAASPWEAVVPARCAGALLCAMRSSSKTGITA